MKNIVDTKAKMLKTTKKRNMANDVWVGIYIWIYKYKLFSCSIHGLYAISMRIFLFVSDIV